MRATFAVYNSLYAPAYLALLEDDKNGQHKLKRKRNHIILEGEAIDEELEKEKAWVKKLQGEQSGISQSVADISLGNDEEGDIECGCCFSTAPFVSVEIFSVAHISH